jgi:hypothetical protein
MRGNGTLKSLRSGTFWRAVEYLHYSIVIGTTGAVSFLPGCNPIYVCLPTIETTLLLLSRSISNSFSVIALSDLPSPMFFWEVWPMSRSPKRINDIELF